MRKRGHILLAESSSSAQLPGPGRMGSSNARGKDRPASIHPSWRRSPGSGQALVALPPCSPRPLPRASGSHSLHHHRLPRPRLGFLGVLPALAAV